MVSATVFPPRSTFCSASVSATSRTAWRQDDTASVLPQPDGRLDWHSQCVHHRKLASTANSITRQSSWRHSQSVPYTHAELTRCMRVRCVLYVCVRTRASVGTTTWRIMGMKTHKRQMPFPPESGSTNAMIRLPIYIYYYCVSVISEDLCCLLM